MIEKQYKITAEEGLHARPATKLVEATTPFESEVILEYRGKKVDMKSIMGVMSLGISKKSSIKVKVEGVDEINLIAKVDQVIKEERLGE